MKKHLRGFVPVLVLLVAVVACASPIRVSETQPSTNEVATAAAMTLQALAPEVVDKTPSLLPRSLYFLGNDSQGVNQIFRMERDGKTKTQLTFEQVSVDDY